MAGTAVDPLAFLERFGEEFGGASLQTAEERVIERAQKLHERGWPRGREWRGKKEDSQRAQKEEEARGEERVAKRGLKDGGRGG